MALSETHTTRQNRTESKEVRRRQLIEATIDSIADNGFAGTTTATVAERANLSHGIINFHFKSKERLFGETIGYLADEALLSVAQDGKGNRSITDRQNAGARRIRFSPYDM